MRYNEYMKKTAKRTVGAAAALLLAAAVIFGALYCIKALGFFTLDEQQIQSVLDNNSYPDDNARTVAEAAVSLVGRVNYFWGGKSRAIGWDDRWGEPARVTSKGSKTSGTVRPFGLDCSGFVTWAFIQINDGSDIYESIGEGTWNQWNKSQPIKWSELRVGDLVFQNEYPSAKSNHVGVCIGYYNGSPVFAHCSASEDNVVVTTAGTLFKYARRPAIFLPPAGE